jgi:NAD(P)-dependent dehydrogenase (short-subunit alcohol dehydrogenase family)
MGIGRAIVTLFLELRAKVTCFDISTAEAAANASELRVKCDVSSETDDNDAVGKVPQH